MLLVEVKPRSPKVRKLLVSMGFRESGTKASGSFGKNEALGTCRVYHLVKQRKLHQQSP